MEFTVNGIPIDDTYCEYFSAYICRMLITSVNRKWALESALETKGLGRSATIPPSEASIEVEMKPQDTPDGRPGFMVQVIDRKLDQLKHWFVVRIRKGVIPYPKTNVFDMLPREMVEGSVEIKGTIIQTFGDGFEEETMAFGRNVYKIPRMDGWFFIERQFGFTKGVAGGMFLILADSDETALNAAEKALEGIATIPNTVGKFAASGTKVGGKMYTNAIATTNDAFCPVLYQHKDSRLREEVKCIYEVIVTGLQLNSVCQAKKIGIENATRISGVLEITSTNYGGNLGKGQISLHSLFHSTS